jgi:hypothetical protein
VSQQKKKDRSTSAAKSVDACFYREKSESMAGKYSGRWWWDKIGRIWWRKGVTGRMAGRSGGKGDGKDGRETRRCEREKVAKNSAANSSGSNNPNY